MKTQDEEGTREDRESTGTGEGLLSAICLLCLPFVRVCKFQSGSGKREKCLSRVRGCLEAGVGRRGPGKGWHWEDRCGWALPSAGD